MTFVFSFKLLASDGGARLGEITTPRGTIRTPAFMPVGTAATVKAVFPDDVKRAGADVILGNTYHLMLRPGAERIARLGGLHRFMRWDGPILTDSGGFQVMSLSQLRTVKDRGVTFRSHIDGALHDLTPERSIEVQNLLGADIQMQFDECTPFPASFEVANQSMELSLRWGERSLKAFRELGHQGRALFGIVQGGTYPELRNQSAQTLTSMGFDGFSIGGLAVGEGQKLMFETLSYTTPLLPRAKPRYLMGVGTPSDIVGAVERGIDMFDCVMPTRSGRHGQAFTWAGKLNMRNAAHIEDMRPIDETSACPAARDYSRAYIHHLLRAGEYLAPMILSWANTHFYQDLMAAIRQSIREGTFADLAARIREAYPSTTVAEVAGPSEPEV
ncbi:MAG: tRNA guanosine(34) transglycosylase Tgt [Rhodomicrobium sp.]